MHGENPDRLAGQPGRGRYGTGKSAAFGIVNNHECEFAEPPVERVETFEPEEEARMLGDVELTIKVSKSPLDDDLRGISIFSKEVWHETTLAGADGKDMAEYLFGEIDVPRLDEDTSAPLPFDVSRSAMGAAGIELATSRV